MGKTDELERLIRHQTSILNSLVRKVDGLIERVTHLEHRQNDFDIQLDEVREKLDNQSLGNCAVFHGLNIPWSERGQDQMKKIVCEQVNSNKTEGFHLEEDMIQTVVPPMCKKKDAYDPNAICRAYFWDKAMCQQLISNCKTNTRDRTTPFSMKRYWTRRTIEKS